MAFLILSLYQERESNPHGPYGPQDFKSGASTDSAIPAYTKKAPGSVPFCRAKDGVRTRDLDLGKVALYQLSYFRVSIRFLTSNCDAKVAVI